MSYTRNIQQSNQYRDVIKQASDIIVYIDGKNYLVNPYLNAQGSGPTPTSATDIGVVVPINDYVQSWSSSYDIDSMIPSGNMTLSVPIQDDHLFRAPGGNNILKTMSEIRVFAKGYYFSPDGGNTMYRQIFKGFISSVNYSVTGKITTISISCVGSLGLLERMQVDISPALISNASQEVTSYTSTAWNLDPYEQIAYVFLYSSMIDGFTAESLNTAASYNGLPTTLQASTVGSMYHDSINSQYVAKWQALLFDLARDAHIFGVANVENVIASIQANTKKIEEINSPFSKLYQAVARDTAGKAKESDQTTNRQEYYQAIRNFMPDMGIGEIKLLNGQVTSRIERLRYMTNLIGFEAYQDVDGGIVVKPPLYNLDVVDVGTYDPNVGINSDNNPFVVQLSEIINESESEDESAVRLTRVTARGSFMPSFQTHIDERLLTVAEEVDLNKLAQFGLRTEPPHSASWFENGDQMAIYAYAVSELAKANRGFKKYNITIPMRPELKLGFPMYIPHRDMYGYIKNVSMSWTRGSTATTTIQLDSLRGRPVFPETQTYTPPATSANPQPQSTQITLMTPRPNLVYKWTKPVVNPKSNTGDADSSTPKIAGLTDNSDSSKSTVNVIASLPLPQRQVFDQELQMLQSRQNGSSFGPNNDTPTNSWQVQVDDSNPFINLKSMGPEYYTALRTERPYTDAKGYELIGPFTLGRWQTLTECINQFTINSNLGATASPEVKQAINPTNPGVQNLSGVSAFLFSGTSLDAENSSAAGIINKMSQQAQIVNNYKVFELSYATGDTDSSGPGTNLQSIGESAVPNNPNQDVSNRAKTLFSGTPTSTSLTQSILDSISPDTANIDLEQSV